MKRPLSTLIALSFILIACDSDSSTQSSSPSASKIANSNADSTAEPVTAPFRPILVKDSAPVPALGDRYEDLIDQRLDLERIDIQNLEGVALKEHQEKVSANIDQHIEILIEALQQLRRSEMSQEDKSAFSDLVGVYWQIPAGYELPVGTLGEQALASLILTKIYADAPLSLAESLTTRSVTSRALAIFSLDPWSIDGPETPWRKALGTEVLDDEIRQSYKVWVEVALSSNKSTFELVASTKELIWDQGGAPRAFEDPQVRIMVSNLVPVLNALNTLQGSTLLLEASSETLTERTEDTDLARDSILDIFYESLAVTDQGPSVGVEQEIIPAMAEIEMGEDLLPPLYNLRNYFLQMIDSDRSEEDRAAFQERLKNLTQYIVSLEN